MSEKATVLIEVASDGFITVYGDPHIQVKIINRPKVSTAENGRRLDEWIDSILPWRYRDIRWPGQNIRAYGMVTPMDLKDVERRINDMKLVDTLNEVGGGLPMRVKSMQLQAIS